MKEYDPSDYTFVHESQGISFLFQDLVAKHYLSWSTLTLAKGELLRVYASDSAIEEMAKQGEKRELYEVSKNQTQLNICLDELEAQVPNFRDKTELSQDEVEYMTGKIAQIFELYAYYDINYTDGMWRVVQNGQVDDALVKQIESYKNVVRERLNMPCFTPDGWLGTLMKILGNQFSLATQQVSWYRADELRQLYSGEMVAEDELQARRKAFAFIIDDKDLSFVSGEGASLLYDQFVEVDHAPDIITGATAHGKGVVRGTVRLIRRDYNNPAATLKCLQVMQDGEILVSGATDPDLMLGLQKAGAIVTDSGGMLSHAAITARELDKICIIGTQNATQILEDGMEVEVDADNGVVRIIK